ncbi:LOW QUALITY PROTEIN: testis-specific gene 10 protein [Acridotheres tristis]
MAQDCFQTDLEYPHYITIYFKGVVSALEVLKILRECEEFESTWKINEYVAEIQGNFKVLTAERDKIFNLYQAQKEIYQLCQEVIKCPRTPKSTVIAQAVLRHMEIERDTALSDFQRMPTEHDAWEQLQISQEAMFNEKAHLEKRIEELETTIHNLDNEQLEQMSEVALMDPIDSLETEMKRLTRKELDSETELSQEGEYASLSLLNEKTESLSEIHLVQQEESCTLKETIAQPKSSLQDCVEGRERIATFQESLAIKEKIISDFKILISELEHSKGQGESAEVSICEKGITSLHQQLQETNKAQNNKNRESLSQENDRLQEHLSNIKQEIQVQCKKLVKYQTELDDMKLKAQDSNDIFRLKHVLKSKVKNCKLLENYHKAREQGGSWEAKCHEAERGFSLWLRLPGSLCEGDCRDCEEQQQFQQRKLRKCSWRVGEKSEIKCESNHSETLLRKQLGNEKASMKNLVSLLVSNLLYFAPKNVLNLICMGAVQNQDFTHLRNRAAQLESELGITKTQLGTECFDRQACFCIVLPAANWGEMQCSTKAN